MIPRSDFESLPESASSLDYNPRGCVQGSLFSGDGDPYLRISKDTESEILRAGEESEGPEALEKKIREWKKHVKDFATGAGFRKASGRGVDPRRFALHLSRIAFKHAQQYGSRSLLKIAKQLRLAASQSRQAAEKALQDMSNDDPEEFQVGKSRIEKPGVPPVVPQWGTQRADPNPAPEVNQAYPGSMREELPDHSWSSEKTGNRRRANDESNSDLIEYALDFLEDYRSTNSLADDKELLDQLNQSEVFESWIVDLDNRGVLADPQDLDEAWNQALSEMTNESSESDEGLPPDITTSKRSPDDPRIQPFMAPGGDFFNTVLDTNTHPGLDRYVKKKMSNRTSKRRVRAYTFPDDISHLKYVKALGGSTDAALVEDPETGLQYVRKSGASPGHTYEESYAESVYRAVGVPVPESKIYETKRGPVKLSEFHEGISLEELLRSDPQKAQEVVAELRKNFAADALLANWDVAKGANIVVLPSGVPLRVDNGSALRYRAQGEQKKPSLWSKVVSELTSMRDKNVNHWAAQVFGNLTDEEIHTQVKDLLGKRAAILKAVPEELRETVSQRLDYLEDHISQGVQAIRSSKYRYNWASKFIEDDHQSSMDHYLRRAGSKSKDGEAEVMKAADQCLDHLAGEMTPDQISEEDVRLIVEREFPGVDWKKVYAVIAEITDPKKRHEKERTNDDYHASRRSNSSFDPRKVWEFIDSQPFYNKEYHPKFISALDIFNQDIVNDPEVLKKYQEFQGSGRTDEHPDEARNRKRRELMDSLGKKRSHKHLTSSPHYHSSFDTIESTPHRKYAHLQGHKVICACCTGTGQEGAGACSRCQGSGRHGLDPDDPQVAAKARVIEKVGSLLLVEINPNQLAPKGRQALSHVTRTRVASGNRVRYTHSPKLMRFLVNYDVPFKMVGYKHPNY